MAIINLYYFNIPDILNDGIFDISILFVSCYTKYMANRFERAMTGCDNGLNHGGPR